MDSVFFNDRGDKYYHGDNHVVLLNSSQGANPPLVNVIFYMHIGSDEMVTISWADIAFTGDGANPLVFAAVPDKYIGTVGITQHALGVYTTGGNNRIYDIGVDATAHTITFRQYDPVANNFTFFPAAAGVITGGSITHHRTFA